MQIVLIRHCVNDAVERVLCGRTLDVSLNAIGRRQAELLGAALAEDEPVLQCSPRRRTHETAMYIAQSCGSDPEIIPALDEIDFGEWSGRAFESLKDSDDWRRWNETRGQSRPPGGERIIEVQSRIADHFDEMRRTMPEGTVVMVSHADVIRAAVCHVLGLSPDNWQRFEITPGSISRIAAEAEGYRLLSLNEVWL